MNLADFEARIRAEERRACARENAALKALLDEASTYVIAANFAGARDDLLRRIDAALDGWDETAEGAGK